MTQEEIETKNSSWQEVEMKFSLGAEQFEKIGLLLRERAIFINNETQTDYYLEHPVPGCFQRSLDGAQDKYMRVRSTEGETVLCYKQWFFPNGLDEKGFCDEYEVQITGASKMLKIFELLGFETSLVIKKHRDTFMVGSYEIALDQVEGLGCFMEIEAKHLCSQDLNEEFQIILEIAREYGIQDTQHEKLGYVQLAKKKQFGGPSNAYI